MVTDQIKQLAAAKAKLARLEKSVASHIQRELAGLPARYGFETPRAFFRAVTAAIAGKPVHGGRTAAPGKRRRRAVITDATRASVKKLAEAGKTGAEIAHELKISLPSVQNIKKALGLVKARK